MGRSSDDRFIIVAFSSVIRVWDTINGKHIMDLNFHKKEVRIRKSLLHSIMFLPFSFSLIGLRVRLSS